MPSSNGRPLRTNGWSERAKTNGSTGRMHGLRTVSTPPAYASRNSSIRKPWARAGKCRPGDQSSPAPKPYGSGRFGHQQVFVERAERACRMGDLDLQDPQTGRRTLGEIRQLAGLVDGMRKVADAMTLDLVVQPPAHGLRALTGEGVEVGAGQAVVAPACGDLVPQRARRRGAGLHAGIATDGEGVARIAFVAIPDGADVDVEDVALAEPARG